MIFILFLTLNLVVTGVPVEHGVCGSFNNMLLNMLHILHPLLGLANTYLFFKNQCQHEISCDSYGVSCSFLSSILPCAYFLHGSYENYDTYFVYGLLFILDDLKDCIMFNFDFHVLLSAWHRGRSWFIDGWIKSYDHTSLLTFHSLVSVAWKWP